MEGPIRLVTSGVSTIDLIIHTYPNGTWDVQVGQVYTASNPPSLYDSLVGGPNPSVEYYDIGSPEEN